MKAYNAICYQMIKYIDTVACKYAKSLPHTITLIALPAVKAKVLANILFVFIHADHQSDSPHAAGVRP